jgi:hypothetical protein
VIFTVLHFFEVAIAWPSAVFSVLRDVSLAGPFDALAVIVVSFGPVRPRTELAILWMAGFMLRALQAAFLGLDEDARAGFATLVVRPRNTPLPGAHASARTSVYVAPFGPRTQLAILWLTAVLRTILYAAAPASSLHPLAFEG